MEKLAVFTGSRNIYPDMIPACKSLIKNSDVDKILLMIEDDEFPYELPDMIETRNVSRQRYFKNDGPNRKNKFTYLAMMRAALGLELPEHDYVVSFDCDIIVDKPIGSYLWDLPLDDYFFAAAREPHRCNERQPLYCNIGVTAHNLKLMRRYNKPQEYIDRLNSHVHPFVDQDVLNILSYPRIYDLDSAYNACRFTVPTDDPKIIHYAGKKREDWIHESVVEKWRDMPWEEVLG